jgi:methylmalonyl-CoA mutase N-terminal domain/subunit
MRERFGARDPRSLMLRFHAQTAGSSLTAQQPNNNIVRVAVQALAAVLGGCQSLHTNALDEALALPTEDAAYAIEWLTDEIERQAAAMIARIDALGGTLRAIESGYIQRQIQNAAYDYQQKVERGERVVVGVNRFRAGEEAPIPVLRIDPGIEREQVERLHALRARRNAARAAAALAAVESRARSGENLMPAILAAVEAYATVGEISDVLRGVFGEYRETVAL